MEKKFFKVLALSVHGKYKTHRQHEFLAEDQVTPGHLDTLIESNAIAPEKMYTVVADFVEGYDGKRYLKGTEVGESSLIQSQVAAFLESGAIN